MAKSHKPTKPQQIQKMKLPAWFNTPLGMCKRKNMFFVKLNDASLCLEHCVRLILHDERLKLHLAGNSKYFCSSFFFFFFFYSLIYFPQWKCWKMVTDNTSYNKIKDFLVLLSNQAHATNKICKKYAPLWICSNVLSLHQDFSPKFIHALFILTVIFLISELSWSVAETHFNLKGWEINKLL